MFSDAMDYETLRILNPYLPAEEGNEAAAEELFRVALHEMVERRLVHWDARRGRYDLHPVVRGFAFDQLEDYEKVATCDRVRGHFESLPPEEPEEATELADLSRTLEIYRLLIEAKRWDRAVRMYVGAVGYGLLSSVASYPTIVELLMPLFPYGLERPPLLGSKWSQSYVMNDLGCALCMLDQPAEAKRLIAGKIKINLALCDWQSLAAGLQNHARTSAQLSRPSAAVEAFKLACSLAQATKDDDGESVANLYLMDHYAETAHWNEAHAAHAAFAARPAPAHRAFYRPGEVEECLCWLKFYQNELRNEDLDNALRVAEQGKNPYSQRSLHRLRAELALQRGDADAAIESIDRAIAMARKSGVPMWRHLGCLARAQARQGHHDAARRTIEDVLASAPPLRGAPLRGATLFVNPCSPLTRCHPLRKPFFLSGLRPFGQDRGVARAAWIGPQDFATRQDVVDQRGIARERRSADR